MAIISLISDLDPNHFQLAHLKSRIAERFHSDFLSETYIAPNPEDLDTMAYHLIGALQVNPPNTIHISLCQYSIASFNLIIWRINNQFVISSDNGLISLIDFLNFQESKRIFESTMTILSFKEYSGQFLRIVDDIKSGEWQQTYLPSNQFLKAPPITQGLNIQKTEIHARIFVITHHGNLILNIQKEAFIQAVQSNNFQIEIRTQVITKLSRKYQSNHRNNIGAIFNDTGYLELFMVGGNLAQIFHFDKYSNNKITIKIGHDSRSQVNF